MGRAGFSEFSSTLMRKSVVSEAFTKLNKEELAQLARPMQHSEQVQNKYYLAKGRQDLAIKDNVVIQKVLGQSSTESAKDTQSSERSKTKPRVLKKRTTQSASGTTITKIPMEKSKECTSERKHVVVSCPDPEIVQEPETKKRKTREPVKTETKRRRITSDSSSDTTVIVSCPPDPEIVQEPDTKKRKTREHAKTETKRRRITSDSSSDNTDSSRDETFALSSALKDRSRFLKRITEKESAVSVLSDSEVVPESSQPRIGGTFRVFSERDHNTIRNLLIPLLNTTLRKGKPAKAAEVIAELADDAVANEIIKKYTRPKVIEKYKSIFKNEMRKKKRDKHLYQYPDVE